MFEASLRSGKYSPRVLSRDPWVVVYDDFLSAQEADQVINRAGRGWSRSQAGDGVQAKAIFPICGDPISPICQKNHVFFALFSQGDAHLEHRVVSAQWVRRRPHSAYGACAHLQPHAGP